MDAGNAMVTSRALCILRNGIESHERCATFTISLGALDCGTLRSAAAVVAVLGLYDKGKTFVLNSLTQSKLPSGKNCAILLAIALDE